jgi:hypothetical protein
MVTMQLCPARINCRQNAVQVDADTTRAHFGSGGGGGKPTLNQPISPPYGVGVLVPHRQFRAD